MKRAHRLAQACRASPRATKRRSTRKLGLFARRRGADLGVHLLHPCALWRLEHLCRLTRPLTAGAASFHKAPRWCGSAPAKIRPIVHRRFSTARPTKLATPPFQRRRPASAPQVTEVESATSSSRLGSDDRSPLAWLTYQRRRRCLSTTAASRCSRGQPPARLPGSGLPIRVDLGTLSLACQVERICYPERGSGYSYPRHRDAD